MKGIGNILILDKKYYNSLPVSLIKYLFQNKIYSSFKYIYIFICKTDQQNTAPDAESVLELFQTRGWD